MPVAQQQRLELLACLQARSHRILSGTREIAQRLVALIRNRNAHQLPGACRTRQQQRIAPIGLDPIPRAACDLRRRDHLAGIAVGAQLSAKV